VPGDRIRGAGHSLRCPALLAAELSRTALRHSYVADFVCFERIILELKAVREIAPEHRAQTLNYLKASGLRLGLLVNFGALPR